MKVSAIAVALFFAPARWWVNERGEPDSIYSPRLIVATSDEDVIESDRVASVGASIKGYVSEVK